jgi:hypothetical protein
MMKPSGKLARAQSHVDLYTDTSCGEFAARFKGQ